MKINSSTKLLGLMVLVNAYPFLYVFLCRSLGGRGAEIWRAVSPILVGMFALRMAYYIQKTGMSRIGFVLRDRFLGIRPFYRFT